MKLLDALNDSYVTFVRDIGRYWPSPEKSLGWSGEGFEALSPTGEIRAFQTYDEAQAWRMAEVEEASK